MLEPDEELLPYPDAAELRRRRIEGARSLIVLAAAAAVVWGYRRHMATLRPMSETELAWLYLPGSVFLAYCVWGDIRSGVSCIGAYSDRFAYTRSSDPVGYWIMIAVHGFVAAAMFVGSLAELLGLWRLPT